MKFGGKKMAISIRLSVSKKGDSYYVNIYYVFNNHHVDSLYGVDKNVIHEAKVFTQLLKCLYKPETGTTTCFDGCLVRLCKSDKSTMECFKYALQQAADICRLTVVQHI